MVYTCPYMFVQTHRRYNTGTEPYCKLWVLGDYDVSVEVHKLTNVPLWWRIFDHRGGDAYGRAWNIWRIFALSTQFCCEPETTLKSKMYFLKGH